ncbi:hypothetical protein [Convivina intestini]|uniref:hypothetical protein n=1 Tax=Convivina intestini TaxID=1505726 RepID=UPI00200BD7BC|nr:hypothetical protein [Convivina intestini]CAH1857003.1 hypothetical protein R078131_01516 [Convivina intestini]
MNHIIQLWEKENHSADLLFAKSLSIFVPNFGPDALSDLIAALIYPQLVEYTKFTLDQNKINYTLSDKTETVSGIPRSIWDSVNGKWVLYRQILIVKNLHLTLIPYELLTQYSKAFDVIRYLSVFLIKNLQNTNNSIKEEINYVGGKKNYITSISNKKEFALKYTESNIDAFNAFVQDPLNKGIGKELDDSKFKYDNSEDV